MSNISCLSCGVRNTCTKLCHTMRSYVNQGYVPKKELTYTDLGVDIERVSDEYYDSFSITPIISPYRLIYELYFLDHKPVNYITSYIPFSISYVYRIISSLKNNISKEGGKRKKEILSLHFLNHKLPRDIIKELRLDSGYVHRVISTYLYKNLGRL